MTIRNKAYFNVPTSVLRADGTIGGTRFNQKDQPTESIFRDLWDSIVFKMESSDRAKTTTGGNIEQEVGLVTMATDAQAKANATQLLDRTLAVAPSQLPTTQDSKLDGSSVDIAGSDATLGGSTVSTLTSVGLDLTVNSTVKATVDSTTTTRNNYFYRLSNYFLNWLATVVVPRLIPSGGTVGQFLSKTSNTDYALSWSTPSVITPGDSYYTTSSTSVTPAIGYITFVVASSNLKYDADIPTRLRVVSASNNTVYMEGTVSSWDSATKTLILLVDKQKGSSLGSNNNWKIGLVSQKYSMYVGSSVTNVTIGIGQKTFLTSQYLSYTIGSRVRLQSAAASANFMEGNVFSYDPTSTSPSLVITVDTIGGSGTYNDWQINIGGASVGGDKYISSSVTSNTIGIALLTFDVGVGYQYTAGNRVRAVDNSNSANYVGGIVSSYSGGSLVINVDNIGGSGTISDWSIILGGVNLLGSWVYPPLNSGYTTDTDTSSSSEVSYKINGAGEVELKGTLYIGTITGNIVFNLPSGFRPKTPRFFHAPSYGSNYVAATIVITTTGDVQVVNTDGTNIVSGKILHLDGCRFNIYN